MTFPPFYSCARNLRSYRARDLFHDYDHDDAHDRNRNPLFRERVHRKRSECVGGSWKFRAYAGAHERP